METTAYQEFEVNLAVTAVKENRVYQGRTETKVSVVDGEIQVFKVVVVETLLETHLVRLEIRENKVLEEKLVNVELLVPMAEKVITV